MFTITKEVLNVAFVFRDVNLEAFSSFILDGFVYVGEEVCDVLGGGGSKLVESKLFQKVDFTSGSKR